MVSERCPKCGCDKKLDVSVGLHGREWGVLYYCGTIYWPSRDEVTTEGVACRQLAQAQERERAALAHNAQLRELLDRHQWSADGCPECGEFESDGHAEWCEIAAALADAPDKPENPLAAYTDGQLYDELRRRGWVAATWAREEASP